MASPTRFDREAEAFLLQLHHIWCSNGSESSYARLRDALVSQRCYVDARIAALGVVAALACQHSLERQLDLRWAEFYDIARTVEW